MKVLIIVLLVTLSLSVQSFIDMPNHDNETLGSLWDSHIEGSLDPLEFQILKDKVEIDSYQDMLRLSDIEASFTYSKQKKRLKLNNSFSFNEALGIASDLNLYQSINIELSEENKNLLIKAQKEIETIEKAQLRPEEVREILLKTPDYAYYNNGEYKDTLKLFLICRKDRSYPCLFVLKDIFDQFVRNEDGQLWSMPALAQSKYGLAYNVTNGQTPMGVHTMDSVMPEANRVGAFGKFRRVILNWVPSDSSIKHLIPAMSLSSLWWKQASLARDVGRKYLRIHGTGALNKDPSSKYYPHVRTSGCVSVREGMYPEAEYIDQRILLDKMMDAMNIAPTYNNEVEIKGMLYVLEIDSKEQKVSLADLKSIGVK